MSEMIPKAAVEKLVDALLHDDAKYPQLRLPDMQRWRVQQLRALLASASVSPQLIPAEWADAANSARGLCESEANRWETAAPSTAAHWRSVAVRLGALYLAQDHLAASVSPPAMKERPRPTFNGHIDEDCEVYRGVGHMCTCSTPDEKAEEAKERADIEAEREAVSPPAPTWRPAVEAILTAVRGDEKSECWTIRRWLDERDIFNDDLARVERLVEAVCLELLKAAPPASSPSPAEDK